MKAINYHNHNITILLNIMTVIFTDGLGEFLKLFGS